MSLNILFCRLTGHLHFTFRMPDHFLNVFSIKVLTLFLLIFINNFNTKVTHISQIFSLVG